MTVSGFRPRAALSALAEAGAVLSRAAACERTAPEAARALAEEALRHLDGVSASAEVRRARGDALVQRGRALFFLRQLSPACDAAVEAQATFATIEDTDGIVRALALQGGVFSALGHDEAALDRLEAGVRLAEDREVTTLARVRVCSQHAAALRDAGRHAGADAAFEALVPISRDYGGAAHVAVLLNAGAAATRAGRLDAADERLAEARRLIEAGSLDGMKNWLAALEAGVLLARGDHAGAERRGAEGIDAEGDGDGRVNAVRTWAQAIARAPEVDLAACARAKGRLVELVEEAERHGWIGDLPAICRDLADLCERTGDFPESVRWHKEAAIARDAADQSRRKQRVEAEQLRLDLARVAVEAESQRIRSETLADLNASLRASSEERERLLAMVAHDLRSPLTAIRICVQHQRRKDRLQPNVRPNPEVMETIHLATSRMVELIDDALSTDSIRRGHVLPRRYEVDLLDLVRRCVRGLSPLAARKKIQIDVLCDGPVSIESDGPSLSRVFENVLTNALKFSPIGGRIVATVRLEASVAVLVVEDEGPGFAPTEVGTLFEFGRKGTARPTADETSSGIGLTVVSDLVRALGGDVALDNREDSIAERGARVVIRVPQRPARAS